VNPTLDIGEHVAIPAAIRRRDYRDEVIEAFADAEAARCAQHSAERAQWRLERAMLLDRIDELTRENEMLNPERYTYTRHRRAQRPSEMQRRQEDAA
jgi:hypothetical protein